MIYFFRFFPKRSALFFLLSASAESTTALPAVAFPPNTVVFGDGDREPSRTQKNDAYVSLDFVAHEYGHLVLNNEVNGVPFLTEAAAINEGVSDIWGALVEHHVKGNRSDTRPLASVWKLAEDFLDNVFADGQTGVRLFSDPKVFNGDLF